MELSKKLALVLVFSASLVISLDAASAQTSGGNFNIPGGLVPNDNATEPVASVGAQYKFEYGFYQKIQNLILEEPQPGDYGVHDGERYYDVIMVVSRNDGDGRDPDETASENKESIVGYLDALGARDIAAAKSLSFVTASIPVAAIPGFSSHDEIYAMGDGELPVTALTDSVQQTTHATPSDLRRSVGSVPNGTGVVVAVVDLGGINNPHLNDKVVSRIQCGDGCTEHTTRTGSTASSHATKVAQWIAASGMSSGNGIAPGVELLDVVIRANTTAVAHALDWSYHRGADVVNLSVELLCTHPAVSMPTDMIINAAVDKGMVVVNAAGNLGTIIGLSNPPYSPISGCAHNLITVGGVNHHNSPLTMHEDSSRGPIFFSDPRLSPHIVAPADTLPVLADSTSDRTIIGSGTSIAAPQVSAAAAILLQENPELTPAEVKAALLLGADWRGPVPCTSAQYEQNNASDPCSYARQPADQDTANNASSLKILNNVGFGILDVAKSLKYASTSSYIMSGHLDSNAASKWYSFTVSDTSDPVKIILTWLVHPQGGIAEQINRSRTVHFADLDFEVSKTDTPVIRADSSHQTTEFAMFSPPENGIYTIEVEGSGFASLHNPVQAFTIASTHQLSPFQPNRPPVPEDATVNAVIGELKSIRPVIADPDGDEVTITSVSESTLGSVSDAFLSRGLIVYLGGQLGSEDITYTVSDGRGGTATGTIRITVVEPPNINPILDYVGDRSINAGSRLSFAVTATDIDGRVSGYQLEGAPGGASISTLGHFSWTPADSQVRSHTFAIVVLDDAGGRDTETITVTVRPRGYANSAPTASDAIISTSQGIPGIARPVLTDPDPGDRPWISGTGRTTKGDILAGFLRAGIIMYQPDQGRYGTETATYTVTDGNGGTDTATVTIFINKNGNTRPVLESIDFRNTNAGQTVAFATQATDSDGNSLSYILSGEPDGATISSQGRFSWVPGTADVGSHTFTVIAHDGLGGVDTSTATIRVLPAGTANSPPSAPSTAITVAPGASIVISPEISDPDGDTVLITDAVTDGDGVIIQSDETIDYIHISTAPTETITYTVTDARGAISTGTITITIQ